MKILDDYKFDFPEEAFTCDDDELLKAMYVHQWFDRVGEKATLLWSEARPAFLAWKHRLAVAKARRAFEADAKASTGDDIPYLSGPDADLT